MRGTGAPVKVAGMDAQAGDIEERVLRDGYVLDEHFASERRRCRESYDKDMLQSGGLSAPLAASIYHQLPSLRLNIPMSGRAILLGANA